MQPTLTSTIAAPTPLPPPTLRLRSEAFDTPSCLPRIQALIIRLLDIQDHFEQAKASWSDPLSKRIYKWIDKFNLAAELALRDSSRQDEVIALVKLLASEILQNPMNLALLDNPLIEEECYIWGEENLGFAMSCSAISPYTKKPFKVHPHELARAILAWGVEFFPATFERSLSPSTDFIVLEKNADILVNLHSARLVRKEAKRQLKAIQANAQKRELSNIQLLLARNLRVEQQIRADGADECDRLRRKLELEKQRYEECTAAQEVNLQEERQARVSLRRLVTTLQVQANDLECRVSRLKLENSQLRQSLACAFDRMNQDNDGDCALM